MTRKSAVCRPDLWRVAGEVRPKSGAGFSLIELMVAVAIVGILAMVAYPSYQNQVQRTRRADAQGALMGLAGALERHFTVNNTYLGAAAGGGDTGAPAIYPTEAPLDGNTKYYDLTIQAATASTYTIAAAPKGAQAGDGCGTLTVTHTGVRGAAQADCWR
jgi:type IV pilus assembly protein PilE